MRRAAWLKTVLTTWFLAPSIGGRRDLRLDAALAFGGELSRKLQFALQRRARFGQLFDVALNALEAFLFGDVAFDGHGAQYPLRPMALSLATKAELGRPPNQHWRVRPRAARRGPG